MSFFSKIAPIAILLLSSLIAQSKSSRHLQVLVFIHVTVIDATGAPAKPDMSVVITGDRITAIGRSSKVRMPEGAHIINASGKYMIPGLWDMHIHSGGYENGKKNFPFLLAKGITGVRDMGSPLEEILRLRQEVDEGKIAGPRMVIAGPLLQGPLPFQMPLIISVKDEAEAKRTVTYLKDRGVDFIKVHDAVPRNIYFAIAEESKRQGIPFAGHVPPSISAIGSNRCRTAQHRTSWWALLWCFAWLLNPRSRADWQNTKNSKCCSEIFD